MSKLIDVIPFIFKKKKEHLPGLIAVRSTIDMHEHNEFLGELQESVKACLNNQNVLKDEIDGLKREVIYLKRRLGI